MKLNAAATARVRNLNVVPGPIPVLRKDARVRKRCAPLYAGRHRGARSGLLVDPTKLDRPGGQPHVINYYVPSWNGDRVAVGIGEGGSGDGGLSFYIFRYREHAQSGRGDHRSRAVRGSWHGRDGHSFFYNRLQEMKPGMPPSEKELKSVVWLHVLGNKVEQDAPVFGYDPLRGGEG